MYVIYCTLSRIISAYRLTNMNSIKEVDVEDLSINEFMLIRGIQDGNLDMIKWLLLFDAKLLYNSKYMEMYFCVACENNRLEMAKMLYSMSPGFDIHDECKEHIFMVCCEESYTDLFIWLLFIFPDFVNQLHAKKTI